MNVFQKFENINKALQAARNLGINLTGVDSRDFTNRTPSLILSVLWSCIRLWLS